MMIAQGPSALPYESLPTEDGGAPRAYAYRDARPPIVTQHPIPYRVNDGSYRRGHLITGTLVVLLLTVAVMLGTIVGMASRQQGLQELLGSVRLPESNYRPASYYNDKGYNKYEYEDYSGDWKSPNQRKEGTSYSGEQDPYKEASHEGDKGVDTDNVSASNSLSYMKGWTSHGTTSSPVIPDRFDPNNDNYDPYKGTYDSNKNTFDSSKDIYESNKDIYGQDTLDSSKNVYDLNKNTSNDPYDPYYSSKDTYDSSKDTYDSSKDTFGSNKDSLDSNKDNMDLSLSEDQAKVPATSSSTTDTPELIKVNTSTNNKNILGSSEDPWVISSEKSPEETENDSYESDLSLVDYMVVMQKKVPVGVVVTVLVLVVLLTVITLGVLIWLLRRRTNATRRREHVRRAISELRDSNDKVDLLNSDDEEV